MTEAQRERLAKALLGEVAEQHPGLRRELEETVSEDVDHLEPIIDEWLRKARQEGRRAGKAA